MRTKPVNIHSCSQFGMTAIVLNTSLASKLFAERDLRVLPLPGVSI